MIDRLTPWKQLTSKLVARGFNRGAKRTTISSPVAPRQTFVGEPA